MTYEEIIFKIADSPLLLIGQLSFYLTVLAFFAAGFKYFVTMIRYCNWMRERTERLDFEARQAEIEEKFLKGDWLDFINYSAEDAAATWQMMYGNKKNDRSFFTIFDEKPGDTETAGSNDMGWTQEDLDRNKNVYSNPETVENEGEKDA